MFYILLIGLLASQPSGTRRIELDDLANLVDGAASKLNDIELVFEGSLVFLNPDDRFRQGGLSKISSPDSNLSNLPSQVIEDNSQAFQGTFAYRDDGSAHESLYITSSNILEPMIRQVTSLTDRSKLEELKYQPDRGKPSERRTKQHGGLLSLFRSRSWLRIYLTPTLQEFLRDKDGNRTNNRLHYEFLGFDTVDSHECIKFQFVTPPSLRTGRRKLKIVYWVDLERDCNVLRYEGYMLDKLWIQIGSITLSQRILPNGNSLWLPSSGVCLTFVQGADSENKGQALVSDEPNVKEIYHAISDTLSFNKSLPDSRFALHYDGTPKTPSLISARTKYQRLLKSSRISISGPNVEQVIEDANNQQQLLEASAPTRVRFSWGLFAPILIGLLGLVLIVISILCSIVYLGLHCASLITSFFPLAQENKPENTSEIHAPESVNEKGFACGSLALTTLLALEGHKVKESEVRTYLPYSNQHSLAELCKVGCTFGLNLKGYRIAPSDWPISRPALIFLEQRDDGSGHFLVIRPVGHTGKLVQVIDPISGVEVIEFEKLFNSPSWSGVALINTDYRWKYYLFLFLTSLLFLIICISVPYLAFTLRARTVKWVSASKVVSWRRTPL